jgi:chorismate mutase
MIRALLLALALASVFAAASAPPGQSRKPRLAGLDPAAVKAIDEMGPVLVQLEASRQTLMQAVGELEGLYAKLSEKAAEVAKRAVEARKAKAPGKATDKLFEATKEMQEMQQSFNLQYLMLQNKISHENRQFSMVSNIMKNKHDTAKNSINNIR